MSTPLAVGSKVRVTREIFLGDVYDDPYVRAGTIGEIRGVTVTPAGHRYLVLLPESAESAHAGGHFGTTIEDRDLEAV